LTNKVMKTYKQVPKPGEVFMLEGQRYELIETLPYTRKNDGKASHLLIWQTHCAECGESFQIKTSMIIRGVNRRCEKHRAPGRYVAKRSKKQYPFWKRNQSKTLSQHR